MTVQGMTLHHSIEKAALAIDGGMAYAAVADQIHGIASLCYSVHPAAPGRRHIHFITRVRRKIREMPPVS
jgi:hypothetical protein